MTENSLSTPPGSTIPSAPASVENSSLLDPSFLEGGVDPEELKENAARMLVNVQKRSKKLGIEFANLFGAMQEKSKHMMQVQAKYLETHNLAVTEYTDSLEILLEEMQAMVKSINLLDERLEPLQNLKDDVKDVLEAVKELDRVVSMLEKKAGIK
eukprot:TRINITY_DN3739_c3_g2_i1.p1 TRINITY_DN3739_c3_g2~~TRINITY_DN3739_c3_g2_i1.p1  ORF type:complete len:180 (+),score=28.20 TRINITY_DN3739_c3_g2_i1:78-542(+)